ncbi:MAG: electron transfer flavoprotein subunit beta, partial [Clostridiales bacterium]|nr:electron transfer flavoprotein subunit beta [Clostridiales bacterium]
GKVVVKRENDESYTLIEMRTPCLVTVTKPAFEPRLPTIKSKMAAKRAHIETITAQDVEIDLSQCGLKGSPTKVKKTFTPEVKKGGLSIEGENAAAAARKLVQILSDAKVI